MLRYVLALIIGCFSLTPLPVHGRSPAPLAREATAVQNDFIVIEDFSGTPVGSLPNEWGWRDKDEDKPKLYQVKEVNGRHYLAARDTTDSVVLIKQVSWNPQEYPIMTWCWRADALPKGGDERYTETNDSAVGVYVIFSKNWLGIPRQIKYLWSTTLPQGTVDRREGIARPWFVVLESGAEKRGQWTFEQVDIYRDYERILKSKPANRMIGIGILTDANSTHSYAEGAYADFRVWPREASAQGKIFNYCDGLEERAKEEGVQDGSPEFFRE